MEGITPPEEWLISQACEEFRCTPSQILREDPALVLAIMELRAYARAKQMLAEAQSEADVPRTPMVERVWEIEYEILRRRHSS